MSSNRRKLSLSKRLFFQFVIFLLVYGLTEFLSLVYLNSTYPILLAQRRSIAISDPITHGGPFEFPMMIHPYIGVVFQPRPVDLDQRSRGIRITEYGFYDDQPPLRKRSSDRVIIALMGGSVARQMSVNASDVLERELSKIAEFQGKTFNFVRLAIDGNKQPQQLMTLNYLLMLGGEFDLVINLDGVNEIALPSMDNVPFGVAAAYPRKWGQLTTAAISRELMRTIGYLTYLRSVQKDFAGWFESSIFRFSPTGCLIWKVRNSQIEETQREQYLRSARISEKGVSDCSLGPSQQFDSQEELFNYCAEIWARSSELIQGLCHANGIRYFHFLQPNQYLPDSKPISSEEMSYAINEKSPFAGPVRNGYPIMRKMASRLQAAEVDFTDLTQVFAVHPETIYKDDCCHVLEAGDQIIAEAISARIKQFYSASRISGASREPKTTGSNR